MKDEKAEGLFKPQKEDRPTTKTVFEKKQKEEQHVKKSKEEICAECLIKNCSRRLSHDYFPDCPSDPRHEFWEPPEWFPLDWEEDELTIDEVRGSDYDV